MNYSNNITEFETSNAYSKGELLGLATILRTPPLELSNSFGFTDYLTGEFLPYKPSQADYIKESRRIRYDLLDVARSVLTSFYKTKTYNDKGYLVEHRTVSCSRLRISPNVKILKSKEHNKCFYGGLMRCANVKTCAVCAGSINERKANELRLAANLCPALGLHMSMITFTAPHNAGDTLEYLLKGITNAHSAFWRGAPAKRIIDNYGIVGRVRSLEIRYGSKGWHPHFHIIIFSKKPLPFTSLCKKSKSRIVLPVEQQSEGFKHLLNRWQNVCMSNGLDKPNLYGLDIARSDDAGVYITKFGSDGEILKTVSGKHLTWDLADEVVKGNNKSSKSKSLSPWDFLLKYQDTGLMAYKLLFLEYARATKGKPLLQWSKGSRNIFMLSPKEKNDEDFLNEEIDSADVLCCIEPTEWQLIVKKKHNSLILELAENGGINAISEYLNISVSDLKSRYGSYVTNILENTNH